MRAALLPLLAILLVSCGGGAPAQDGKGHQPADQQPARAVKITTATSALRDLEQTQRVLGRILDPRSVTVAAEVPGRVAQVTVETGRRVKKGELLARLDATDLAAARSSAEADLARARAEAAAQTRLTRRYRKLARERFVSATMLDQAEARLIALRKAVEAAKARLTQARHNLARAEITAPVAGTVQRRWVAAGDYIGVGKPMFRLVTDGALTVALPIPETRGAAVRVGTPARLHLPGDDQVVAARVDELTPAVGAASNAFQARVRIAHPPEGWRPGGSVIAELVLAVHRRAVVVPEGCVVLRPAGEVVYLVRDGRVAERKVVTGVRRAGEVEITKGLAPGVTLAAVGAPFLTDGAQIRIVNSTQR